MNNKIGSRFLILCLISLIFFTGGCGGGGGSSDGSTDNPANGSGSVVDPGPVIMDTAVLVSTVAGMAGEAPGSIDGMGEAARFYDPRSITRYDDNLLYIVDYHSRAIRRIDVLNSYDVDSVDLITPDGTAVALGFIDESTNEFREFAGYSIYQGITTDGTDLYVADTGNNIIRKITTTGVVTTLAGKAGVSGSSDGTGEEALFKYPTGITAAGPDLYVTDSGNNTIRKISAKGAVTILAGKAGVSGSSDGTHEEALFKTPTGITTDGTFLYVTDTGNSTIRQIDIGTGQVTTLAGKAGENCRTDGSGSTARFIYPSGITKIGTNLYVADTGNDTIRKIAIDTGTVTTLAGLASNPGSIDGTGDDARFHTPRGIVTDGLSLYVADSYNNTIRKIEFKN